MRRVASATVLATLIFAACGGEGGSDASITDTTSSGGTVATSPDDSEGPAETVPEPGDGEEWGTDIDVCSLLEFDEVVAVFPDSQPASEESGTPLLQDCAFFRGPTLQVSPPDDAVSASQMSDSLGTELVTIDGIGDWAYALIDTNGDAGSGAPGAVMMMTARNDRGTLRMYFWSREMMPGTPAYESSIDLLSAALDRL